MLFIPNRSQRLFAIGLKYSDIDWLSLSAVLSAFGRRIDQWYLEPVRLLRAQEGQHGAFAALGTICLLIDSLCQYDNGKPTSNRSLFIKYVRDRLPRYVREIRPAIRLPKVNSQTCEYETTGTGALVTRNIGCVSEALYSVFRCGILHEAHVPVCGVISGLKTRRFSIRPSSLATYSDTGAACPVVLIDPWKLFDDVEASLRGLVQRVALAPPSAASRTHFNRKFQSAFGIDISAAR